MEDDPRSDRPVTVATNRNVASVKELVDMNAHINIDFILDLLGISHVVVYTVLEKHLQLRKISSLLVFHELTQEQ